MSVEGSKRQQDRRQSAGWRPACSASGGSFRLQTADDETIDSNWTVVENVWTSTGGGDLEHDITGLTGGTQYDVQVRAIVSTATDF